MTINRQNLVRGLGLTAVGKGLAFALYSASADSPHLPGNDYEFYKVPWRAGTESSVEDGGRWHDPARPTHDGIDFEMGYGTPLHAVANGTVRSVDGNICETGGYGLNLRIDHPDGLVSSYAHMSANFFSVGTNVVQGQYVGRSGNSGNVRPAPAPCGGNPPGSDTRGSHLHFSLYDCDPGPGCDDLDPNGLSYFTDLDDSGGTHAHRSDNAGVGDLCGVDPSAGPGQCTNNSSIGSAFYGDFVQAYNRNGAENGPGSPANPCGSGAASTSYRACWWVHPWGGGHVQDFRGPDHGHGPKAGAIMKESGVTEAYWVHGSIWQEYLSQGGGEGWLGYPICDEFQWGSSRRTDFRGGLVWRIPSGATAALPYDPTPYPRICPYPPG